MRISDWSSDVCSSDLLDAFVRIAIALTVQRLVLAELLEQDHRKQARAEHAARGRVARRGRLTYRFAGAAGEALAHGLVALPPARDHLERLGDVLAQLIKINQPNTRGSARNGAVRGKSVSVLVEIGCRRIIKKN